MSGILTDEMKALVAGPNLAFLATINPNGSPQVSPLWVDIEDDLILVNSAPGRIKVRNIQRDARVAISIVDRENPYRRVMMQGRVVETITGQAAEDHIHLLAGKYQGTDRFEGPDMVRIMYKIMPERAASR